MSDLNQSRRFWDQLIQLIEAGRVVPVVGPDLLTVPDGSREVRLYPLLAERLAAYLSVASTELPVGRELDEVACSYLKQNGSSEGEIYAGLNMLGSEAGSLPIPKPLLQLAAIEPLRLFVTTTFDSFLVRALDQARFQGVRNTKVLAYSPGKYSEEKKADLSGDELGLHRATVYHLLGKLSGLQNYAVTQWDMVEFFHDLQSDTRGPERLFDHLNRQSLLILGSSLGGWLARFFMRMAKGQTPTRGQMDNFFADGLVSGDSTLVLFLQRYNQHVKIFPDGGPVEFVEELHRRWMERHPASESPPSVDPSPVESGPTPQPESGNVFLSYASEDKDVVRAIKDALEASGVSVFFDQEDLKGGDLWRSKIQQEIEDCSLFVPVISRHTLTLAGRYFREEWTLAIDQARQRPFSQSFLFPVLIDETTRSHADIPAKFKEVQWQKLPGGNPTPDFVALVQQLYRKYQKSLVVGF